MARPKVSPFFTDSPHKPLRLRFGGSIDADFFESIEEYIEYLGHTPKKFLQLENLLIRTLAMVHVTEAIKLSYGPKFDPHNPRRGAWQIPVRRIRSNYIYGWKVKKVSTANWLVYNDSRAAYFVEYGIHTSPLRVPRPILKMSYLNTVRRTRGSRTYERFSEEIFKKRRNPDGTFLSYAMGLAGNRHYTVMHKNYAPDLDVRMI